MSAAAFFSFFRLNILPYTHPKRIFTISQSRNRLNENKMVVLLEPRKKRAVLGISVYTHTQDL